jgi:hypothetical protein
LTDYARPQKARDEKSEVSRPKNLFDFPGKLGPEQNKKASIIARVVWDKKLQ